MVKSPLTILIFLGINAVLGIALPSNSLDPLTVIGCGKGRVPAGGGDRIVGGDYVKAGQYPWTVSLQTKEYGQWKHVCGGSILNENWVVTSPGCVYADHPGDYEIIAGIQNLSEDGPAGSHYKISEIHVHPNYSMMTLDNDIALLKMEEPIDIEGSEGYINGICLPSNKDDPTGYARTVGWGQERYFNGFMLPHSDTLKQVVVPIIDRSKCSEAYSDGFTKIQDTMLCAGTNDKSPCWGDVGGPLFQTDGNGISTLYGITSFNDRCGITGKPHVFSKVSVFRDWMMKVMLS